MKAVVLKTDGKRAAVMDGDGSVRIIENRDYSRGQVLDIEAQELPYEDGTPVYEYEDKTVKRGKIASIGRFIYRHASQAAAVAAVVLIAGGMSVYAAPVKTVTSDTTPSISYKLNVFDRVVRVEAADDSEELPEELMSGVAGKPFDKAVDIARDTLEKTEQKKQEEAPAEETVLETEEQVLRTQPEISLQENGGVEQFQNVQAPVNNSSDVPGSTDGDDEKDNDNDDDNNNNNDTNDNDAKDNDKADKDGSGNNSSVGSSGNNNSNSGTSFEVQGSPENKITSDPAPSTGTGLPAGAGSDAGSAGQAPETSPSGSAPAVAWPTTVPDNSDLFMTVPGTTNENANYGSLDIAPPNGDGTGTPNTGGGGGDSGDGGAPETEGDHAPEGEHSEGGGPGGEHSEGGESGGGPEGGHGDGGGPGGSPGGRR